MSPHPPPLAPCAPPRRWASPEPGEAASRSPCRPLRRDGAPSRRAVPVADHHRAHHQVEQPPAHTTERTGGPPGDLTSAGPDAEDQVVRSVPLPRPAASPHLVMTSHPVRVTNAIRMTRVGVLAHPAPIRGAARLRDHPAGVRTPAPVRCSLIAAAGWPSASRKQEGRPDGGAAMTRKRYSELTRPARMRKVAASLLGSAASLTLLIVIYYAAPLDRGLDTGTLIIFGLGLLGFVGVITWQMRAITRSHLPRLRAIQAFATGFPLLLVLYAATYILIGHNRARQLLRGAEPDRLAVLHRHRLRHRRVRRHLAPQRARTAGRDEPDALRADRLRIGGQAAAGCSGGGRSTSGDRGAGRHPPLRRLIVAC